MFPAMAQRRLNLFRVLYDEEVFDLDDAALLPEEDFVLDLPLTVDFERELVPLFRAPFSPALERLADFPVDPPSRLATELFELPERLPLDPLPLDARLLDARLPLPDAVLLVPRLLDAVLLVPRLLDAVLLVPRLLDEPLPLPPPLDVRPLDEPPLAVRLLLLDARELLPDAPLLDEPPPLDARLRPLARPRSDALLLFFDELPRRELPVELLRVSSLPILVATDLYASSTTCPTVDAASETTSVTVSVRLETVSVTALRAPDIGDLELLRFVAISLLLHHNYAARNTATACIPVTALFTYRI